MRVDYFRLLHIFPIIQVHIHRKTQWNDTVMTAELRLRYWGDCARVNLNGTLVQDNFYNADQDYGFRLGVCRFLLLF